MRRVGRSGLLVCCVALAACGEARSVIDAGAGKDVVEMDDAAASFDAAVLGYVEPEWERVISAESVNAHGVQAIASGAIVFSDPRSLLYSVSGVERGSAVWPADAAGLLSSIERSNADVAVLFVGPPTAPAFVRQYDPTDLSVRGDDVWLPSITDGVLYERDGVLYALVRRLDTRTYELLTIVDHAIQSTVTLDIAQDYVFTGRAVSLGDGRMGFCAIKPVGFATGYPELLRVHPETSDIEMVQLAEEATALIYPRCSLLARADGLIVHWDRRTDSDAPVVATLDATGTEVIAGPTVGERIRGTSISGLGRVGMEFVGAEATLAAVHLWRFGWDATSGATVGVELPQGEQVESVALDGSDDGLYLAVGTYPPIGAKLRLLRVVDLP